MPEEDILALVRPTIPLALYCGFWEADAGVRIAVNMGILRGDSPGGVLSYV